MANNKRWMRVTHRDNIPLREGKVVELDGHRIAIFNLGDAFLAVDNRCPHRGGPLADGLVSGSTVVCPLHAWAFHLNTGAVANHPESPACIATYPLRIEEGILWLEIPAEQPAMTPEPVACERDRPVRWVIRKPVPPANVRSAQVDL